MKIIIEAPFSEEDLVEFGKFLREMWKDRKETCFVLITEGLDDKTVKETLLIFKKVFEGSEFYHKIIPKNEDVRHLFNL